MKQILPFLLVVLLTACSPAAMQTSEVSPAGTMSETSEVLTAPATAEMTVTPEVTITPSPSPTPEAKMILPNVIPDGEMGCYKDDMCMGLEVADGTARYAELANAFVASYENREWMASMGIKDIDGFMKFLASSEHLDPVTGQMRKGWIPLVAQDGKSTFKILQGKLGPASGTFSDRNPAIVKAGGFFFDHIAFVAASKAEMDANVGGVADWVKEMEEQNGRNVLVDSGADVEQWGLAVVDNQLVFVGLNKMAAPDSFKQKDRLLGQPETKKNGQIMSAFYELYTRVYAKFANNKYGALVNSKLELDSTKWYSPLLCIAGTGGCEGKSPISFAGDDALFVPAE